MSALLSFFSILLVLSKATWATNYSLPFSTYLDADQLVSLEWGFDKPQGIITFQLAINTTGWLGFGFWEQGSVNIDIVIGGVGPNGIYFKDYSVSGTSLPVVDKKQSYTLLSLTEQDGKTVMTFQRPVDTCDDKDLRITDKPIYLIYAYGETDEIGYHVGHHGQKQVNLLNFVSKSISPDAKYLSVKVTNITVPPKKTYYHCKLMKLPNLTKKHHIYRMEPDIENTDVVHHMLLYSCPSYVNVSYDKECYMGDIGDICFRVVASWAIGGEAFELPENTGIPIGENDGNTFYRLEIHYNNPQMKSGIRDNSGLKLYYTDQLRQQDVGILTTGVLDMHGMEYNIPPKASEFHTYGICNTGNFSKLAKTVPELQVFAVLLHSHLAGRKIRVGHFRNEQQIDFLALNEYYDFNMQQIVSLGSIKTVKQGDEIVVECTYNTENRNESTKMGLSTTDEMCLAFLFYYPAIDISACISHPNTTLLPYFGGQTTNTADPAEIETILKTLPQIELISNVNGNFSLGVGNIRDLMKTPNVVTESPGNAPYSASRHLTPGIVSTGGIMLSLLWSAKM